MLPPRSLFSGIISIVAATVGIAAETPAPSSQIENSVVRISSTVRAPEWTKPWTKQSPKDIVGSGVIIEGKRILTNAHLVLYASQIMVQGNQSGEKIPATVEAVAPGIDLALLKLENEAFFDTRPPLPRSTELPAIKDAVMAYGYPTGGTGIAITKGIVSRIDFTHYNFPVSGLRIQIDAAINPGNSGGPALSGDKMIGLAFGRLGGGDNIGYIIPNEEIDLFLADAADGRYDGKPAIFEGYQNLQNPTVRRFLKLAAGVSGVVVTQPDGKGADYPLQRWDVITHIGKVKVDEEGMVKVGALRVRFAYLVQQLAKGGRVPLTILRNGQEQTIELPVSSHRPTLLPNLEGQYPEYFIYGPLVFSTPTSQLFATTTTTAMNTVNLYSLFSRIGSPLVTRRHEKPAFPDEQLVMVSSTMFPHRLGRGYFSPMMRVVKDVNGTPVKNLVHLVELIRDLKDEFVIFTFHGLDAQSIVLPRAETLSATEEILNDNGVRAQASPALLGIWKQPGK
jgi:S1-C subfamily serine protease